MQTDYWLLIGLVVGAAGLLAMIEGIGIYLFDCLFE